MWLFSASSSTTATQGTRKSKAEQEEQLHRKRVAQILRYISTMQMTTTTMTTTTTGVGASGASTGASEAQCFFVRTLDDPRRQRYGPFLQDFNAVTNSTANSINASWNNADDEIASVGARVLFTLYDFQRLALVMAASDANVDNIPMQQQQQQQQQLPFSFYTAGHSSGSSNNNNYNNYNDNYQKRNAFGRRAVGPSSRTSSSVDSCWLRLTRLTAADVPTPPPISPPVIAYLQSWLADDRFARLATMIEPAAFQFLEHRLLSMDRLRQALPPSAPPKIQRWWRRYTHYRKMRQVQRQVEPLYNHLFEWYHQTQENSSMDNQGNLDLIWGLGQAQLRNTNHNNGTTTVVDGPLLDVHVEVELARDGALLVRPKEHAGVSLNRHVMAAIALVGTNTTTSPNGGGGEGRKGRDRGGQEDDNNNVSGFEATTATTATTGGAPKTINSGESTTTRQLRQLVEGLNASDLSPGQPSTYVSILKRMAVELSSGGTFQTSTSYLHSKHAKRVESLLRQGQLVVSDAWCGYSAPRPSAVWARDACAFAEKICVSKPLSSTMTIKGHRTTAMAEAEYYHHPVVIPRALKALTLGPGALEETKERDNDHPQAGTTAQEKSFSTLGWFQNTISRQKAPEVPSLVSSSKSSRPPFPLPTSDTQNRIAELLLTRNYPAVVCEGPPGTGKTHTIANIVCAYLCQGKRVLVTSKGAPALSVLRERLPECVQELCVDVSKSESSGMRQLQQTVERLANKVAWVNTERELSKSNALQAAIEELEEELRTIDSRLGANAEQKRELVQTQQGQDLFECALDLIETAPWLMKTIASWDAKTVQGLCATVKSLVIGPEDPMAMVGGFESPPSDALISLAACNAGSPLSYLQNATKEAFAKVPLLGSRVAEHCSAIHEQLDAIRINGVAPTGASSKEDWRLIVERLKRDKAIQRFCEQTLDPLISREGWPRNLFIEIVDGKQRIREQIVPILDKASKIKQIAEILDLSSTMEEAIEIEKLDKRRAGISSRIQMVAEDLVAARVVAELSKNFSADAQSALVKFAQVSGKAKFGKSSQASKMTQRQRRKRQEYLDAFEKCVRYIPCWILTSSQISDYLPPECLFDLVVIDEASQSDVTVLPGMLRGRQWLIVGDGKQVSPTESFVAEEQIEMLKAAMPESPFEASMLPGHSFFDLCAQAFPMGRVILREHFRCAPEIISYSNLEFYNGNLIPLRLPTSKERLKPSLIDLRIAKGRKVGKINEAECDEIVNQISQYVDGCSLFKKRSIGVISLVGEEQSRLIRGRLLDRIGPHKYKLHNILVGEPPSFQGAERDIVFLSMVCSPGSVVTQSQLMHAQRVNVALSRARDRMVLVRSIDTNHIPNEQDVKFSVLEFFERAKHAEETKGNTPLDDAEKKDEVGRDRQKSLMPFRSRAERLLVKLLEDEGFAVRSMGIVWDNAICVEDVGGTDDSSGRRAAICVEATGETQEEWKAMLEQQKSIERVGWNCMRVDGVSFLTNYSEVLGTIKKFLAAGMVYPRQKSSEDSVGAQGSDIEENETYDRGAHENDAIEFGQGEVARQQTEEVHFVLSSDDDDEEEIEKSDLKPAALPGSTRKFKQEPVEADTSGLGNGETAADYGNVADLGFLGIASNKYESEEEEDDDDEELDPIDSLVAPIIVATQLESSGSRKKRRTKHPIIPESSLTDNFNDEDANGVSFAAHMSQVATGKKRRATTSVPKLDKPSPRRNLVTQPSSRTFHDDDLSVTSSSSNNTDTPFASAPSRASKSSKRRKTVGKYSSDTQWIHEREDDQVNVSNEDNNEPLPSEQQQEVINDEYSSNDEEELQGNLFDSDEEFFPEEIRDV